MKNIFKALITIILLLAGLIILTYFRMNGIHIHIFNINVSAETVNVFVDSMGTYLYLTYASIVLLVVWGFWIGRAIKKKSK